MARATVNDRLFFTGASLILVVFVFAAFARTFYLHSLFRMPAPSTFLQFHGAVMSGWIALLAMQAALVSVGQTKWHRRIGFAVVAYAALMVPIGCMATLGAARREVRSHSGAELSQLNVLGLELTQMVLFASFVAAGLWLRNRPDFHKRIMVVATLVILPNAVVRLSLLTHSAFLSTNFGIMAVWTLLVAGVVAFDTLRYRRLHPAFGWAASISIAALYVAWAG